MGKETPTPPAPVDPNVVASAQTASNQQTGQFQSQLNNGNVHTPFGSLTRTQDPNTSQWTSTVGLTPQMQGMLDRTTQAFSPTINSTDSAQAVNDATHASYNSAMNLMQPQMQQNAEHQNAALVAQGLNPNDAAWQNSQTLFNNSQNELLNQAANTAVQTGQQEQNTLFGQDAQRSTFGNNASGQLINELGALTGQGSTGFTPTSIAPTDVTGAYALNQQQQAANYQAALQQQQSSLGGLMQLGQAAIMFA